ncbi:hypothetical protein [Burkholderia thailandensis]|uniref:hypothetical protein n=1 Tax=Burkholderia thailandensis TaxID=57975 RepID=UPI000AB7B341|nr:hypothetical protein [Burkholderia thailandensis]
MSTPNRQSIRDRVQLVIRAVTTDNRRFKELEERTAVPAATWRSFWNRDGALPSGAMLEELGREWPQFAFWTLTGIDDWENGHVAPHTAPQVEENRRAESAATTTYFMARIKRENKRPSSLPAEVNEGFDKLAREMKAIEMLGGHTAVAEIREELVQRGIIEKPMPLNLTELYDDTPDPVITRALEVLERTLKKQESAELLALKTARDTDLLTRKQTSEVTDDKSSHTPAQTKAQR